MPLPIDDQVPEEDKLKEGLENDLQPKPEKEKEHEDQPKDEGAAKLPYHQDPNVQLYIERQVAKRVGEGSKAWEDRIAKLEDRLREARNTSDPVKIGDWTPGTPAEAKAAKAIVQAAKQEMLDDLSKADEANREQAEKADQAFSDWLTELQVTGTLKTKEDQQEFAKLIVEYGVEDKGKAVALWNRLQVSAESAEKAAEEKKQKKAQEAQIGSGRKGGEPGQQTRSFQQRKAEEPNFDAILERELSRLTNN